MDYTDEEIKKTIDCLIELKKLEHLDRDWETINSFLISSSV